MVGVVRDVAYSPFKNRTNFRSLSICPGRADQNDAECDGSNNKASRQERMEIENHFRSLISLKGQLGTRLERPTDVAGIRTSTHG